MVVVVVVELTGTFSHVRTDKETARDSPRVKTWWGDVGGANMGG